MVRVPHTIILSPSHRWLAEAGSRGLFALLLLGLLTACGLVDSGGSQGEPPGDAGPDQTVEAGERVVLRAATTDGVASFMWSQNSGPRVELINAETATASFIAPATAQRAILVFTLNTQDEFGATNSDQVQVTINLGPIANAGRNQRALQGGTVALNGSASADRDGTLPSTGFAWRQVAGTNVALNGADTAAPTFTVPLSTPAGQVLGFRLTVTDSDGARDIDMVDVTVGANLPPIASAGVNQNATEGDPVSLNGLASSDPEGRPVIFQWAQTLGPPVALTGADTAAPSFTAPDVAVRTTLTFQLTVTDDAGLTASDTVSVNVLPIILNVPPTANAGVDRTVDEGDTVVLNGNGSMDSDGVIVAFQWSGSVALANATTATPSFIAPDVTQATPLIFTLVVTDDDGATGSDMVVVTVTTAPVNQPPVANNDNATTSEDVPVTVDVAGNDTDADGVVVRSTVAVSNPTNGTAVHNGNGTVTYTPAANFSGSGSFNYTIRDDDNALSNVATVTITVTAVNDGPPVANPDSGTINSANLSTTINVIANDTDPDGAADIDATTVIATQGANGSVIGNGSGMLTYTQTTPDPTGAPQSDSFSYTVADAAGARSGAAQVSISVGAAIMTSSACWTTAPGATLTGRVKQEWTGLTKPLRYSLVKRGAKGAVKIADPRTGAFSYTPAGVETSGSDRFTYQVQDASGKMRQGEVAVVIGPKLMALGDSITAGVVNGAQQLPVPEARVGYRAPLQRQLKAAGYEVDFVGGQAFGAGVPNFDYQSEAHIRHTAAEIARGSVTKDLSYPESGIYAWLTANPADFVLLHLSPHNFNRANVAAVETILDEIDRFERNHHTSVHVFLARVVDRKPRDPRITTYNDQVEAMAEARVTNPAEPDRVTMVDQQGALSSPADLHDSRHPTPAGYSKMAQTWFKAIRSTCRPGVSLN